MPGIPPAWVQNGVMMILEALNRRWAVSGSCYLDSSTSPAEEHLGNKAVYITCSLPSDKTTGHFKHWLFFPDSFLRLLHGITRFQTFIMQAMLWGCTRTLCISARHRESTAPPNLTCANLVCTQLHCPGHWWTLKRAGPKIELWGTLLLLGQQRGVTPFSTTLSLTHQPVVLCVFSCVLGTLFRRILWGMVSVALLKPTNPTSPRQVYLSQKDIKLVRHDFAFVNPC